MEFEKALVNMTSLVVFFVFRITIIVLEFQKAQDDWRKLIASSFFNALIKSLRADFYASLYNKLNSSDEGV